MTRTLFFLFALAAMLMAMSAVLIRIELAYPGTSTLFTGNGNSPDSARFNDAVQFHSMIAYLAVTLLGTTLAAAAREQGARLATLFVALGLFATAVTVCIIVLSELPPLLALNADAATPNGLGWVLYPPLSTQTPTTFLEQLLIMANIDTITMLFVPRFVLLPAAIMLFLGIYCMMSTLPGLGWFPLLGVVLIGLAIAALLGARTDADSLQTGAAFILVLLPIIAGGAVKLIDGAPAWVLILTVGAMLCVAFHVTLAVVMASMFTESTAVASAVAYLVPLGIAWFALPALIAFRSPRDYPEWTGWAVTAASVLGLLVWVFPMFTLGLSGQPRLFLDYPSAYAPRNLQLSVGVIIAITINLALVVALRRGRAPR